MPKDISVQILAQTSENIQKLFDLSTRIDERVKAIQEKQEGFDNRVEDVIKVHNQLMQKVAVLESKDNSNIFSKLVECEKQLIQTDKRLTAVESTSGDNNLRWSTISTFVVQLVWVLLAAWVLTKFNLQAPAVP